MNLICQGQKVSKKVQMKIDPDFYERLKQIVDHHVEWLIDLDYYEEIETIFNCKVEEI